MVEKCRQNLALGEQPVPVEVREEDLRDTVIEDASVVALNFTLQFIDRPDRLALLSRIAGGMRNAGVLLLSEKVCFHDPVEQQHQTEWHHDFKRAKGYSDLEIARKRNALEKVLEPESWETHQERLFAAGFQRVERWFQCFSFQSFIAFR